MDRKTRAILGIGILVMIIGIIAMSYPYWGNLINQLDQDENIVVYNNVVQSVDTTELDEMWSAAKDYNRKVLSSGLFKISEDDGYEDVLNPGSDGLIGYVEVPSQNIRLPIYHGTEDEVLDTSVGHLHGTSLPTDGEGVHSIITGHTGLVNTKIFTDIDKMVEGEQFTVSALNRVLTYQVDDIQIVWPDEVYNLTIDSNENYCTLVTCTPYGVNDHRLLVRGKLVDVTTTGTSEEKLRTTVYEKVNTAQFDLISFASKVLIAVIVVFILGIGIKVWRDNRY